MKLLTFLLYFFVSISINADTTHNIDIFKFKFSPQEITIKSGDTIRWTNKEKRQYHSVWFEQLGEAESAYFFPDEFYEKTFNDTGDFPYRCGPHPKMTGIVHVVQATKDKMQKPIQNSSDKKPKAEN